MGDKLAIINAIWIGTYLGPVHVSCLKSFVIQGHKVILHSYECPKDKPDEVEFANANQLIPYDQMFKHRETGSLAVFSDLMRYELLRKEFGLYVDCDMYCLKPILDANYIVGCYDDEILGNAVLKLPPSCPVLTELCSIRENNNYFPPWLSNSKKWKHRIKKLIGIGGGIEDIPWGALGPGALTYYIKKYDLLELTQPIDIFYPVNHVFSNLLLDQELSYKDLVTHRTKCIHLSNYAFLQKRDLDIELLPTCPLKELINLGRNF